MKKNYFLSLVVILLFLFTGCGNPNHLKGIENADNVTIGYGLSSYAMFSSDKEIIKTLSGYFTNLSFEATDKKMDISTMFSVDFSKGKEHIAKVCVDKNGVFWLDGSTKTMKNSSGKFDYNKIMGIYNNSKKT